MKKFLSILLAVMMVLSTVSFAAPSAIGTMDTATEVPVVEVPEVVEEVAELAATAGDKSSYGTLIYSVDFEGDFDLTTYTTAYGKASANASYSNPDFDMSNVTAYTNASGDGFDGAELVTEDGNTYVAGTVNAGYDGFFRMTKYNMAWPEGYYTFSVDVKVPAGQLNSFAQQCNDTKIALTQLDAFDLSNGEWQSVVNQTTNVVNGADMYGFFVALNSSAAGTVAYDNWEVYYRPATVTLTIDGTDYELSTDNAYSADTLASYVTAPTGYVLSGISLTEGGELLTGEQYFFEDTTLYPVYEKDTTIHEVYGKPLFIIDFEREDMQGWYGHTQDVANTVCNHGAQIWEIATKYDERFAGGANYRVRFLINEGTHVDQQTVTDADGNHYTQGTTQTRWPQVGINNWGSVTGEAGVYTFSVDTWSSIVAVGRGYGSWTVVDPLDMVANEWDKVVVQQTLTEAGNVPSGMAMNFDLGANYAGATIAFDNAVLYYKPNTADVTLVVDGEEYVAEDVATTGVSAASILEKAGISAPYGTKPVLSATKGGESVGNTINLVMDSTFFVSFEADDSIHPQYGKRMFFIDFENLDAVTDFGKVSAHTDDYDAAYANATINWEVGVNEIVEEDGNKFIKGQQGWAQVRINNDNYASLPAGKYTMSLKTKNFGDDTKTLSTKDQNSGTSATWVNAGAVTGTINNYEVVNGEWNEVASQLDYASKDFTIFYTAQMTTDVAFDDVAIYYLPESVNLTIVNGDETITKENVANGTTAEELLSEIPVPFGYKVALSTTGDVEDVIEGALTLVSDATLYVVNIPDEKVHMEYGEALVIIDYEREDMQGWAGTTQEIDNSVMGNGAYVYKSASYYDERFEGKNFRVRFVINESTLTDQTVAVDENGNHYTTGTNTTRWPQVCGTNYGSVQGEAGTYTYMFDVKIEETTETSLTMSSSWTMVDPFSATVGSWDTVIVQTTLDAAGNIPNTTWANFGFAANNTTKLSFDNAKIYFKPLAADVKLVANGEVVATKTDVSTSGVLASDLVDGVKVKGYAITGVKLGTTSYELTDTVNIPCDCTVELVLTVQDTPAATPETSDEMSIRVDDPTGIRYKASLAAAEDSTIVTYGWVVARADQLGEEELTIDFANKVVGYGRLDGEDKKSFYESDDEYNWFTGILYFSATEEDGYPKAERLAADLVARPFAVVDGEYLYGEATEPTSLYDVAVVAYGTPEIWDNLTEDQQSYLDNLMVKVEDAGLGE